MKTDAGNMEISGPAKCTGCHGCESKKVGRGQVLAPRQGRRCWHPGHGVKLAAMYGAIDEKCATSECNNAAPPKAK